MQLFDALGPSSRAAHLRAAVDNLSHEGKTERGAVFTRPEVVAAVLDLAGYDPALPLHQRRLLEPSVGEGDFLVPVVERLLVAWSRSGGTPAAVRDLEPAIRGVEIHEESYQRARAALVDALLRWGATAEDADWLAHRWLTRDDFLLAHLPGSFDFVVGNPPYVRQERIPAALLEEYRRRYTTIHDRADLYVPFYERGLHLLAPGGRLAFICANRWVKNKYGGPLRALVARGFHLRYYVDLEGADAFHSEVIAYPSITVIERGTSGPTRVARQPEVSDRSLRRLTRAMLGGGASEDARVAEIADAVVGADPWLLDDVPGLALVRDLERRHPTLEEDGCRVGIGVATGADRVFIGDYERLPVEDDRKLRLATSRDLIAGEVRWGGKGVVNPWNPDGSLAPLDDYPRFAAYLEAHRQALAGRHCARDLPRAWYRTIDRIYPDLTGTPKLLIPDIKGEAIVACDPGGFYPHHNLYWVTSTTWDLPALATVLRSSVALLFVSSYSVRMAGGFLRFQAQYLRRVRVPAWSSLSPEVRAALLAADPGDQPAVDAAVFAAYGMGPEQRRVATRIAEAARVKRKEAP